MNVTVTALSELTATQEMRQMITHVTWPAGGGVPGDFLKKTL